MILGRYFQESQIHLACFLLSESRINGIALMARIAGMELFGVSFYCFAPIQERKKYLDSCNSDGDHSFIKFNNSSLLISRLDATSFRIFASKPILIGS